MLLIGGWCQTLINVEMRTVVPQTHSCVKLLSNCCRKATKGHIVSNEERGGGAWKLFPGHVSVMVLHVVQIALGLVKFAR